MSFRRIPKEIDPRRPPKRRGRDEAGDDGEPEGRSYGQYIEVTPDDLAELERATDEVAREGSSAAGSAAPGHKPERKAVEAREEFEEATDEVSREDPKS